MTDYNTDRVLKDLSKMDRFHVLWEYLEIETKHLGKELPGLGLDRWELVAIEGKLAYLKRPKQPGQ